MNDKRRRQRVTRKLAQAIVILEVRNIPASAMKRADVYRHMAHYGYTWQGEKGWEVRP